MDAREILAEDAKSEQLDSRKDADHRREESEPGHGDSVDRISYEYEREKGKANQRRRKAGEAGKLERQRAEAGRHVERQGQQLDERVVRLACAADVVLHA